MPNAKNVPEPAETTGPAAAAPTVAPSGADPVVGRHLETLMQLRAAIARWQSSRAELQAELQVLASEEARLVQAGEIGTHADAAVAALTSMDLGPLRRVSQELSAVAEADPRSGELAEHATLIAGAAEQLVHDLETHRAQSHRAPEELEEVRERLRSLRSLQDEYDRAPVSAQVEAVAEASVPGPGSGAPEAKVTPPTDR